MGRTFDKGTKEICRYGIMNRNIHVITSGATSSSFTAPHIFVKYITDYKTHDVYKREKYVASILSKFDWFPQLLYADDRDEFFVYRNCGVPVDITNRPRDIEKQFENILRDMNSVNVQHNDIKRGELLVDGNGKLFLCDFGWASVDNNINCGIDIWGCDNKQKPGGYYDDVVALKRCGFV